MTGLIPYAGSHVHTNINPMYRTLTAHVRSGLYSCVALCLFYHATSPLFNLPRYIGFASLTAAAMEASPGCLALGLWVASSTGRCCFIALLVVGGTARGGGGRPAALWGGPPRLSASAALRLMVLLVCRQQLCCHLVPGSLRPLQRWPRSPCPQLLFA